MIRKFIDKLRGKTPHAPDAPVFEKPKDSWNAGDIAECVIVGGWHQLIGSVRIDANGPEKGDQFRVASVAIVPVLSQPIVMLRFRAWGTQWFSASAFRKVIPTKDEATTDESITLDMLIGKPVPLKETT